MVMQMITITYLIELCQLEHIEQRRKNTIKIDHLEGLEGTTKHQQLGRCQSHHFIRLSVGRLITLLMLSLSCCLVFVHYTFVVLRWPTADKIENCYQHSTPRARPAPPMKKIVEHVSGNDFCTVVTSDVTPVPDKVFCTGALLVQVQAVGASAPIILQVVDVSQRDHCCEIS